MKDVAIIGLGATLLLFGLATFAAEAIILIALNFGAPPFVYP